MGKVHVSGEVIPPWELGHWRRDDVTIMDEMRRMEASEEVEDRPEAFFPLSPYVVEVTLGVSPHGWLT